MNFIFRTHTLNWILMGPTVYHLHILVQRLLPLQPHFLIKLLYERFHSPIQLVLTQRRLFSQLPSSPWSRRRAHCRRRLEVRAVPECLRFHHIPVRRRIIGGGAAVILKRVRLLQVPRERHVTTVRYRLPRALQRLLPLRLRHPQCPSSCKNFEFRSISKWHN